jgi:hypothetical protein
VKIDAGHVIIALVSAGFILGLGYLALKSNAVQLWSVVAVGASAWITTIVALLKGSALQPSIDAAVTKALEGAAAEDPDKTIEPGK